LCIAQRWQPSCDTRRCAAGSWSEELSSFLSGFSHHLVRRRLPRQAHTDVPLATRLPPAAIAPVATELVPLALAAMHHKTRSMRNAALETLTNYVYFAPQRVLRAVLTRFWEALEATNSVHQISGAIRTLAGASF
jgi:Proteasome-substrate-size regulator, mid region